jgi:DNA-binding response OmpR family regulator
MTDFGKTNVALVEDDAEMRSMLTDFLTFKGFHVESYSDPSEFLAQRGEQQQASLSLLISDISMPTMSGLELLKRLRTYDRKLPVVLISANASQVDEKRAASLGVSAVMEKPLRLDSLFLKILTALGSSQASAYSTADSK